MAHAFLMSVRHADHFHPVVINMTMSGCFDEMKKANRLLSVPYIEEFNAESVESEIWEDVRRIRDFQVEEGTVRISVIDLKA